MTFIRNNGSNVPRREAAPFSTDVSNKFPTHGVSGTVTTLDNISGGATNFTFQNNTDYQFSFLIERVSATQTTTLLRVMEGATERYAVGGTSNTTNYHVFDTATLRLEKGAASFDNVQLTFIPEPSAALLGGLGLLALLRRRR